MRDLAFVIDAFFKTVGWTLALILWACFLPVIITVRIIKAINKRRAT